MKTNMRILTNTFRHNIVIESFGLFDHSVMDWFSFCREVCLDWYEKIELTNSKYVKENTIEAAGQRAIGSSQAMRDPLRTYPGFTQLCVNHYVNFVDHDKGVHINGIEMVWWDCRSKTNRYGTRQYHMEGYIAEFAFKGSNPVITEKVHQYIAAISSLYLPL
ncbi:hypothetical protein RF11_05870 [Thelohanellus kitauei]|uniref:Uncharacterized protein n=1 Tax=Thelohanellus kitauei TaxID=669202 RepID=A0A0C2IEV7_THEKT|nr:hypothetical protein RF11_05870 [Thelohanellus kitauei]